MKCWVEWITTWSQDFRSINNLRYVEEITLTAEGKEELKRLLRVKEESEKASLKLSIQKTKIMASGPIQFSSVAQLCPTLCDPMNCSTPGFPVHHHLPEFTQIHVHQVGDAIQPSHPLLSPLLLPPIPPSIRVFSNESTLHMRWPKYWSFSFRIIPSTDTLVVFKSLQSHGL